MCAGGEEQSEPHLEEVHCSSPDVLLQRPGQTAEGSTNQTTPGLKMTNNKKRKKASAVTRPLLPLQVDCSDYDSDGSHDLIGSFTTTVNELQKVAHGSPVSSLITNVTRLIMGWSGVIKLSDV